MLATEAKKIWMDGKLLDAAEAKVSVLSHTLHYGVGVFEGIRCYPTPEGPAIFRVEDHVRRLLASARMYRMPVAYSLEEIVRAIDEVQLANGVTPSYIRPLVYRGSRRSG